jgi:cell division protein FtsB
MLLPGLDDELPLLVVLDATLPPINGHHGRQHVDAGGEALLDQRSRQSRGVGIGTEGGENDDGVDIGIGSQFFSCTHDQNAILWHTVKRSTSARDSQEQQPRKRRRTVQYLLLAVGCVLLIDALVGDKGLLAMMQARARYRELEQSLAGARTDNARLREEAQRLREDPGTIEEIARRELGLIRRGEKLFIIKDVESGDRR